MTDDISQKVSRPFTQVFTKLFWISRPVSWLNTAYPFAAGYLLSGGSVNLTFVIGTVYFLIAYNLLMYGVNDVFDYESDILNPRKGGIEGMREERIFHPIVVRATLIMNLPPLLYLYSIGSTSANLILSFVVFMVLAYSVKYLRFKERPILDSFTSSCHFVGPLIYGLALTGGLRQGIAYISAFFLWGMASHAFGAVQDIIPDRAGKIASIATIFGAQATVRLTIILYAVACGILISRRGLVAIIGIAGLSYVINIWKYRTINDDKSAHTNRAWKRFIWLNYFVGFIVTLVIILRQLT